MRYGKTVRAEFIDRPNRFMANVIVEGRKERVHVKNTGRCKELLVPGATVVLEHPSNPDRKTRYDLISVFKGDMLVNMDSQAPNKAFGEFLASSGLFGKHPLIKPEFVHGDSRFDFYLECDGRKCFIEVKGVTLEHEGICSFPDAPTERGLKHIRGLMSALDEGYECYIAFVVQMKGMKRFVPNYENHEEFGVVLEQAYRKGVGILVYDCIVTDNEMIVDSSLEFGFRRIQVESIQFFRQPIGITNIPSLRMYA